MSEMILRFSNGMCKLLRQKETRLGNCRKCKYFKECNEVYLKKLNKKIEMIKKPELLSAFDFEQQFRGKKK